MDEKITSRHLTFDLYACKLTQENLADRLREDLPVLLKADGFHVLMTDSRDVDEKHVLWRFL